MMKNIVKSGLESNEKASNKMSFSGSCGYRVINGFLNRGTLIEFWQKKGKAIAYTVNEGALA